MKAENSSTRPLCIGCNRTWAAAKGRNGFNGVMKYRRYCNACRKSLYQRHKKDHCEDCGFVPIVPSQLDVDHCDGDHMNNEPTNLRTLCANCHRLKTALSEDWKQNYQRRGVTKIETN